MTHFDPAGGGRRQKKKSAASESKRRGNGTGKIDAPEEPKIAQTEPPPPDPVGGLERTRRLFLAALRVWKLKRRIRD